MVQWRCDKRRSRDLGSEEEGRIRGEETAAGGGRGEAAEAQVPKKGK